MACYAISYDLRKPGRDYESLYQELRRFSDRIHPLESLWFVETNETPVAIRDRLKAKVDTNDKLIVSQAKAPAAWHGLSDSDSAWLAKHLV